MSSYTRTTYMPTRLIDQVAWSANFAGIISGGVPRFGLTQEQIDGFVAVNTTLQTAWTIAENPATNSEGARAARNSALQAMKSMASNLVSIIQGTPSVTDQEKVELGVTVRDKTPSKISAPSTKPFVMVKKVEDRMITIELWKDGASRGKPPFVTSGMVFTSTGPTAPTSVEQWKFAAVVTRTGITLPFPPSETVDTVWISAFWVNAKGESGPSATAVSAVLYPGGFLPSEMEEVA